MSSPKTTTLAFCSIAAGPGIIFQIWSMSPGKRRHRNGSRIPLQQYLAIASNKLSPVGPLCHSTTCLRRPMSVYKGRPSASEGDVAVATTTKTGARPSWSGRRPCRSGLGRHGPVLRLRRGLPAVADRDRGGRLAQEPERQLGAVQHHRARQPAGARLLHRLAQAVPTLVGVGGRVRCDPWLMPSRRGTRTAWCAGYDTGQRQSGRVVSASVHRVGDPCQPSVEVAGDLNVESGGLPVGHPARYPGRVLFRVAPLRTVRARFPRTRLSSDYAARVVVF